MTSLPEFTETPILGLYMIRLDYRPDQRGWFEEVWQREKWLGSPLPNFIPVQQNASSNSKAGTTRGLHAEPWNKLVTVVSGKAFCAWVDLREGPNFGKSYWAELSPGVSYFVPQGVANGYQAIEDNTVYTYLVDSHWSPRTSYLSIDAFDLSLAIPWPIDKQNSELSEKDNNNPKLADANIARQRGIALLGSSGQVGRAIQDIIPEARPLGRNMYLNLGENDFGIVINAAAFTRVDEAEEDKHSLELFSINHGLVFKLSELTKRTGAVLVHYSSDYVFDGSIKGEWSEDHYPRPLSKYGLSKLLGDYAATRNPKHYIIRTSWVYGDGDNFIRTILQRALNEKPVSVVNDQFGRPTSAKDLAVFTRHLVDTGQAYGIYNYTGSGKVVSWFDVAKFIFEYVRAPTDLVSPVTTHEYQMGKAPLATRPSNSALSLEKVKATGFFPPEWRDSIGEYLDRLKPTMP